MCARATIYKLDITIPFKGIEGFAVNGKGPVRARLMTIHGSIEYFGYLLKVCITSMLQ